MMDLDRAYEATDIQDFMDHAFPAEWAGVVARILETGVDMTPGPVRWAPLWSSVPRTVRKRRPGCSEDEHRLASVLFRSHDCLHQLWGLPNPRMGRDLYMRVQMCGEVAVLTITEFALAPRWLEERPDLEGVVNRRRALPLLRGPMRGLSLLDIGGRLNDVLHLRTGRPPSWVREDQNASAFVADYDAMLAHDRKCITANYDAWETHGFPPDNLPQLVMDHRITGTELTRWMIQGFERTLQTAGPPDWHLRDFNAQRRARVMLPDGWQS